MWMIGVGVITLQNSDSLAMVVTVIHVTVVYVACSALFPYTTLFRSYSGNGDTNLFLQSNGNATILLQNVTTSNGHAGSLYISQAASLSDTNGTYNNNLGHGIELGGIAGAVSLSSTTANGNAGDGFFA